MIEIQIDDEAMSMLEKTVADRMKFKKKYVPNAGKRQRKLMLSKTDTDKQVKLRGLSGEYALSKYLDIPLTHSLRHSTGSDRGFDFAVNGTTIEMKTTRTPLLIINKDYRRLKGDIAVDAEEISPNRILLRGWVTREDFYERCYDKEYRGKDANGCRMRDVMNPIDLNPIDTLKEYLDARKDPQVGEPEVP